MAKILFKGGSLDNRHIDIEPIIHRFPYCSYSGFYRNYIPGMCESYMLDEIYKKGIFSHYEYELVSIFPDTTENAVRFPIKNNKKCISIG